MFALNILANRVLASIAESKSTIDLLKDPYITLVSCYYSFSALVCFCFLELDGLQFHPIVYTL